MKKLLVSLLSMGLVPTTFAAQNIVYGTDSRLEAHEAPAHIEELGRSTAVMVPTLKLISIGKSVMLPPTTLKSDMNLCDGERFEEQLSPGLCSGFLVGPDLLVTAGHCVTSEFDCEKNSWVFDFKVQKETGRANVVVPAKDVYKCKRVIDAKLVSNAEGKVDYSLIQLERVSERKPLSYRTTGKISDTADIFVIGYPSGLPQKYAPDAKVGENAAKNYFQANLDTFGGNSGSSVFNAADNRVEGILVRGAKDYVLDPVRKCRIVNTVAQDITDWGRYGESVSRITDIPSLKYRLTLMLAARNGDLATVKALVKMNVDPTITDNRLNSALHFAVQSKNKDLVGYLLSKGLSLDAKNLDGKTPRDVTPQ